METYLRRIDPRTMDAHATYTTMSGEEGVFENFYDFELVAIELGVGVERVESLVASGKLTIDSMHPKSRSVALAEVRRCAVEMVDELAQWRHEDYMAKKSAARKAELAEEEKLKKANADKFVLCRTGDKKSPRDLRDRDPSCILWELRRLTRLIDFALAGMLKNEEEVDELVGIEWSDVDEVSKIAMKVRTMVDELFRRQ